jgi:3-isopropylmalate dehydratase small subunit|tara:strand:- start:828 stop:989 length:162 start_codon:yes stop_codon:yes gene_type:complete
MDFWIAVLFALVICHSFADIFFVRWVLWRNKLLTKLAVHQAESESLSSSDEQE